MISCVGDGTQTLYCYVILLGVETSHSTDDNIHIWDRASGETVHRVPAKVQVVEGSRRSVAWSAPQEKAVRFVTAGEKELKFWSAIQDNFVNARQNAPNAAIRGGPPAIITLDDVEFVGEDTSPPDSMYTAEIEETITQGQGTGTGTGIIHMDGNSEKAGQPKATFTIPGDVA